MAHNFPDIDWDDLAGLVLGDKIGEGVFREVYQFHLKSDWVIKREKKGAEFMNANEWMVWCALRGTKLAKWLAPCHHISANGVWLIQQKVEPITKDRLPKKVPAFLGDLHLKNWGWLDGRPVCVDYAILNTQYDGKLVKADWYAST